MPRKPKTAQPETAASSAEPRGTKTAAIQAALNVHPDKKPKEIAELLNAEGWDVKPQSVSVIKSNLKAQRKAKRATPAAAKKAAPAAQKTGDAISLDALKKAKELAAQLGGISKAKAAIAALSELLD